MKPFFLTTLLLFLVSSCVFDKEQYGVSDKRAVTMAAQYILASDQLASTNILINSGFEMSRDSWSDWGGSDVITGQGIDGSAAMRVIDQGGFGQAVHSFDPTKSYTLSFQAKLADSRLIAEGGVQFYDANWNKISSVKIRLDSKSFKTYVLNFTLPPETANFEVYGLRSSKKSSKGVFFDNFILSANEEVLVASAIESDTTSSPLNHLSNPGFELGFSPWANWGNASVVSSHGIGSSKAMRVSGDGGFYQDVKGLDLTKKYMLSFNAKRDSSTIEAGGGIQFYDANWTMISKLHIALDTQIYKQYSVTFSIPSNARNFLVYGDRKIATGSVYYDNFVLSEDAMTQAPAPTPNKIPTVNAGLDKQITLPTNSLSITATAADADGTISSYLWKKVSGPTTGTMSGAATATLKLSSLVAGDYVFSVTVKDNLLATASDSVSVKVIAQTNKLPIVSAGADGQITLPTNSLSITATASDADGTISSYLWKKVSGPTTGTMSGAATATLKLSSLVAGDYVFSVTVKDNLLATASDSVSVKVNPAPTTTPPPAPSPNLLINSGFEMGFTPWGNWGNASVVAGHGINGSAAVRVAAEGGFSQEVKGLGLSKNYKLSFHAKKDSSAIIGEGGINFYDANWNLLSSKAVYLDSQVYKQYDLIFTIPSNSSNYLVYGYRGTATGNLYFDNFVLSEDGSTQAPEPTPNQIPTVSLGADRQITLPINSLSITANAADADGSISSYQWTKVSGPSTGTMAGTTSSTLQLSNLVAGDYVYSVTVRDNLMASASDSISIKVNSAPTTTPPPSGTTDPVAVISGAKYYVSSTLGDDTRTALQAQNASTPWKTLAKINSIQTSLKPGDGVLFKRGDVFFGTLNLRINGTLSAPIKFSSYGSGARPIFTAFRSLSGWTQIATGIYETSYTGSASALNLLAINGKNYAYGRYPKLTAPNNGFLRTQTGSNDTTIKDSNLPSGINWTGAEVVVRKANWVYDRISVKSQSGTTLTLQKNASLFTQAGTHYAMKVDQGYFIQNHIAALKTFGDWAYDPLTKKVKVFFGSNSPANYKVEVPHADFLVNIDFSSHLAFSTIDLMGSGKNSFHVYVSPYISISHSKIQFSGLNAISGELAENFKLENSEILDTQSNGLVITNNAMGFTSRNNIFRRTSHLHGMSGTGDGHGFAMNVFWGNADNSIIEGNQIYQTGYVGIAFNGTNSIVRKNLIDTYCTIKSDGGAIYTYNGDQRDYLNRTISDNIITNSAELMNGVPNDAVGIYIDDNGNNVIVTNNSVSNTGTGIYLHNTWNVTVSNNLVSDNHIQFMIMNDWNTLKPMKNNIIQGNTFIAKNNSQLMLDMYPIREPISAFGQFSSNKYITPFDNSMIVQTWTSGWEPSKITFAEWKQNYNKDATSTHQSLKLNATQGDKLTFIYNATPQLKTSPNYHNFFNIVTGQTVSGDITIAPYRAAVLFGAP